MIDICYKIFDDRKCMKLQNTTDEYSFPNYLGKVLFDSEGRPWWTNGYNKKDKTKATRIYLR